MYMESWIKVWCPECKAANWNCQGDLTDCTRMDAEALECHACSKKFWIDSEWKDVYYYLTDPECLEEGEEVLTEKQILEEHANVEKGRETPR